MEMASDTQIVTFLGRKRETGITPTAPYSHYYYKFAQAKRCEEPRFLFGPVLWDHLRRGAAAAPRLVVLGSVQSCWELLIHELAAVAGKQNGTPHCMKVAAAIPQPGSLDPGDAPLRDAIARLRGAIAEALQGIGASSWVEFDIIPEGGTEGDQVETLLKVFGRVGEGVALHVDVTHGLRSMPMLGMLAAMLARRLRHATIKGLWYAAADLENDWNSAEEAPVLDLKGLLSAVDWLEAEAAFRASGNVAELAPPFAALGEEERARRLREAGLLERRNRSPQAAQALQGFAWPRDGIAGLFERRMAEHGAWARVADEPDERARKYALRAALAFHYLERGDLLRAVLYANEWLNGHKENGATEAGSQIRRFRHTLAHAASDGRPEDRMLVDVEEAEGTTDAESKFAQDLRQLFAKAGLTDPRQPRS